MNEEATQLPRLALYRFLALAFYEPSQSLVDLLESEEAGAGLAQAADELLGPDGASAAQGFLDAYLLSGQSGDQASLDLQVEYNRLFVGPAAPMCAPYQSVYDKSRPNMDRGTMLGPTAEAVAGAMRQEGLAVVLDHAELPDHVAVILEFMYFLLSRAGDRENGATYTERAAQFSAKHVAPWLAEFGGNVAKQARHPFYAHAGRLLELFAAFEAK
jgi:TorA maturation chaperone TorD